VPPFEEWEQTLPGDHPRMREMVALARGEIAEDARLPRRASAPGDVRRRR
jgi:hypothetical protein